MYRHAVPVKAAPFTLNLKLSPEDEIKSLKEEIAKLKEQTNDELQLEIVKQFPKINQICDKSEFEKMIISRKGDTIILEAIHTRPPKRSHVFYLTRVSQVEILVNTLQGILENEVWRVEHHF